MRHHSIAAGVMLLAFSLAICGCSSPRRPVAASPHTLPGNPRFPAGEMAKHFTPEKWQRLEAIAYVGYVIMKAQVRPDGSVALGRKTESYPDASWDLLARALAQQVRLHPTTVGTHLDPKAEIYVVFFPRGWDGNLVLIFGQQIDGPNPGMPSRATSLFTTRY